MCFIWFSIKILKPKITSILKMSQLHFDLRRPLCVSHRNRILFTGLGEAPILPFYFFCFFYSLDILGVCWFLLTCSWSIHGSLVTAGCWTLGRSQTTGTPDPRWFMTLPQCFLLKLYIPWGTRAPDLQNATAAAYRGTMTVSEYVLIINTYLFLRQVCVTAFRWLQVIRCGSAPWFASSLLNYNTAADWSRLFCCDNHAKTILVRDQ